jgi:hypothetical protein
VLKTKNLCQRKSISINSLPNRAYVLRGPIKRHGIAVIFTHYVTENDVLINHDCINKYLLLLSVDCYL